MTDEGSSTGVAAKAPAAASRRRGWKQWVLWIGVAGVAGLLLLGGALAIMFHRAEPLLRASLIDTLQKRFHARVELNEMHVSMADGFQVEGSGLRIWLPKEDVDGASPALQKPSPAKGPGNGRPAGGPPVTGDPQKQEVTPELNAALNSWRSEPWIVVNKLRFHASWRVVPGRPIVASVIYVQGVQVLLPPKEDRPQLSLNGNSSSGSPESGTASSGLFHMPQIVIGRIECQDARLVIEKQQQAGGKTKVPLDFEIKQATLIPDGKGGPVAYQVELINPKPVGLIHASGHFGPWAAGDPGELPINGDYRFENADLSTIKGIAGTLSSTGHYTGTLRRIEVDGQTQTPDFRLERVSEGSGLPLRTTFHAIVDGTNGDTWLQPVDAMLGHTHIVAKGEVVRADEPDGIGRGHDITLTVAIDRGRIEDILEISANREEPFMTGNLTLGSTQFHLPPAHEPVMDRLHLEGEFHLSQARFTNSTMQGRIEELSLRGQGKPKEVKITDPTSILSEMQGHFRLGDGMLQLPDLTYRVPGAEIVAHGTYGMKVGTLAFDGDARLEATLSKIVGGWKGFLLKPADRWLKKNGAGTDVPIHVEGTRKQPKFGVDFDRLGKTDDAPPGNQGRN